MTQGQFRAAPVFVMHTGQSLNILPVAPNNMPTQLQANYPAMPWRNKSIGATSWSDLNKVAAAEVHPYAKAGLTSILIMNGGTRDIGTELDTGLVAYNDTVAYAVAARAAGYDKIIACTLVRAGSWTIDGAIDLERQDYNTRIMADASTAFDGEVNLAADPSLDDCLDTNFYNADQVHWIAAGAAAAAAAVKLVLDPILAA